jgi:hypothetical protein
MLVSTVDLDLREQRELDLVVQIAERLDGPV